MGKEMKKEVEMQKETALERQQKKQLKEMELIIKALESSNNLLNFRLEEVLEQLTDSKNKVSELEKELKETHKNSSPAN
jgi:hypothetical protein